MTATASGKPIRLVPKLTKARATTKKQMLKQLEFYREAVENDEIDCMAVVVLYTGGGSTHSYSMVNGKWLQMLGVLQVLLHRFTRAYLDDD